MPKELSTITTYNMRTKFFMETDRAREPVVVVFNKYPVGLFIPCNFDEETGEPDVSQVCQQLRELESEGK